MLTISEPNDYQSKKKHICMHNMLLENPTRDVYILLFDQGFQVHSQILSRHSAYFKATIDLNPNRPDLQPSKLPSGEKFKKLFRTRVEDGLGYLKWQHAKQWAAIQKGLNFKGSLELEKTPFDATPVENVQGQINAFKIVLEAMYDMLMAVGTSGQLALATKHAERYKCLPIFSSAVTAALPNSPKLLSSIPTDCASLLEIARKLRIGVLFKECLLHLTGPWQEPRHLQLVDPELKEIGEKAHKSIQAKLSAFNQYFENTPSAVMDYARGEYGQNMEKAKEALPEVYRALDKISNEEEVEYRMEPILRNNLKLDTSRIEPGEGKYSEFFFCADIEDDDLPWDHSEDW